MFHSLSSFIYLSIYYGVLQYSQEEITRSSDSASASKRPGEKGGAFADPADLLLSRTLPRRRGEASVGFFYL